MRIGIDARLYVQTGVGRYLRNLISELGEIDTSNKYVVFLRKEEYGSFEIPGNNWQKQLLDVPWHTIKEQLVVPIEFQRHRIDVAHFPYFNVPIFYLGKYLLTIHDLIVDHFDTGRASTLPPVLYKTKRLAYSLAMRRGIGRASAISVISQTTKQEVIDHYNVNPKRLKVTYDALDEAFQRSVGGRTPKKRFLFPYVLYVGNAYPHKNLEALLEAFVRVRKKDVKLVLAGDDSYFYPKLKEKADALGLTNSTIFFGNANDTELIDLYSHAKCLAFPSLMEGFGLPTFEALACGCLPVISDIPVFREIWDNDLPMFDPSDVNNMAKTFNDSLRLSRKKALEIVNHAVKKIHRYSWKKTAEETLKIYKQIYINTTN